MTTWPRLRGSREVILRSMAWLAVVKGAVAGNDWEMLANLPDEDNWSGEEFAITLAPTGGELHDAITTYYTAYREFMHCFSGLVKEQGDLPELWRPMEDKESRFIDTARTAMRAIDAYVAG